MISLKKYDIFIEDAYDTCDELNHIIRLVKKINPIHFSPNDDTGLHELVCESINDAKKIIKKINKIDKDELDNKSIKKIEIVANYIISSINVISKYTKIY